MTEATKDEVIVLALAKLNHSEAFTSFESFEKSVKEAQSRGVQFEDDFRAVLETIIDNGWINESGEVYEITDEGRSVYNQNLELISADDLGALKFAKSI